MDQIDPNKTWAECTDEEKEVNHLRYFAQHIMRLSSGRFALLTSFTNATGIRPIAIGTLTELEEFIRVPKPDLQGAAVPRPPRPIPPTLDLGGIDL